MCSCTFLSKLLFTDTACRDEPLFSDDDSNDNEPVEVFHLSDDSLHDETYNASSESSESSDEYSDEFDIIPSDNKVAAARSCTNKEDVEESSQNTTASCSASGASTPCSSIVVQTTSHSDGSKRKWDKKSYCFFCQKPQAKLWRHMSKQHQTEKEVEEIENASAKAKKNLVQRLRNMGNHLHNVDVLKANCGVLVVNYRPKKKTNPKEYAPCQHCYAYLVRSEIWRHRCPFRGDKKQRQAKSSKLLLPPPTGASVSLGKVLASSRDDEISRIIKSDWLIIKLGEKLLAGIGPEKDSERNIRGGLRRIGRLLQRLRIEENLPNANLASFLTPQNFRRTLNAAKLLAGYQEEDGLFSTPSLALKLGHSLKKCATILQGKHLEDGDTEGASRAASYRQLVEMNWSDEVSRSALRTLTRNKMNKPRLLPLTEDIVKLSKHLKEEAAKQCVIIENASDSDNIQAAWKLLNEAALASIILFNRKRAGEVSKMSLSSYEEKRCQGNGQKMITESLSILEQELSKTLQRVEIIGKKGRIVPVLLTKNMSHWLQVLVQNRNRAMVSEENQFLFATPCYAGLGHIRGTDVLRVWSSKIDAQMPELLRSTNLRKQIATVSQVANLQDNELDLLARFLGHDIRVHRNFYRLPDETLQVARISKLLIACSEGGDIAGKKLSEIEVTQEEGMFISYKTALKG